MFHGISDAFVPIQPCHDFVAWFKATNQDVLKEYLNTWLRLVAATAHSLRPVPDALLAHVAALLN
jgi:hypothetical protein